MNGQSVLLAGAAALAIALPCSRASGVTIRDDQAANPAYTTVAVGSYPSVGLNGYTNPDTTGGVLVSTNWVLTAAHAYQLNPTLTTFTLPSGNSYNVVPGSFSFEPTGADLVLFRIQQQVGGAALPNASQVATLYTGNSELNNTGTYVGYGRGGIGTTGETPALFPAGSAVLDVRGEVLRCPESPGGYQSRRGGVDHQPGVDALFGHEPVPPRHVHDRQPVVGGGAVGAALVEEDRARAGLDG